METELVSRRKLTLAHAEVILLALTLLATVIISALTLRQTTRHFEVERTSGFVARFNGQEMVALREHVDRWLKSGETPAQLYARSLSSTTVDVKQDALDTIARLRTMANYFQEFGTALKIGSLDENYAHELLGGVCIRYGSSLEPFVLEARVQYQRPQAYEEVLLLRDRMEALDSQ